ncbi:putative LRR containing protein [Trachipleistophora hominis]|uniref:Putative LRR containing protein n=1 Tax=Trachipleistophora hominis TaxID=72359 RepID=L7JT61_TRAHO|nr:putative LRR containing protein [Trachipleistophora hominis]
MNLNSLQSTVLASVFVIVFNPKYEEKVIGENDYLVVDDTTDIWFKPEDLFIYGEWNGNKSVEQICYNIFGSEIAVKPKSESRGDNMNDNGKDSTNKTDVDLRNNVAAYKYQTITLPISKALYEKISNLSFISDTKFTFGEICDLLTMSPRLFDKEALIMFNVFKNLVNDRNLFLKLNQFFRKISVCKKRHIYSMD